MDSETKEGGLKMYILSPPPLRVFKVCDNPLCVRAKNQQKQPKDQQVTEPEQQPKPLSPVEQKVQEARAERAPGPEADEETLAALRVSQIGMRAYARKGTAPHPKQPPAPSTVRPKTHKGMEL